MKRYVRVDAELKLYLKNIYEAEKFFLRILYKHRINYFLPSLLHL